MVYGKRLQKRFFMEPTLKVAENLLGKVLVRNNGGEKIQAVITETEAYCGLDDKASHASAGDYFKKQNNVWVCRACLCVFNLRNALLLEYCDGEAKLSGGCFNKRSKIN